jgi:hypothetical protein
MGEHQCIDCKAGDPTSTNKPVRKLATSSGQAPRCATHLREVTTRRRKQARAARVQSTYNLSAEDNHSLFLLQGGKCWLCQKATGATKSLAVDHDHKTGEVRGRLCGPCNQFIGRLGDDPEAAQRLVAYLTGDTPYRRLKAAQVLAQREGRADLAVLRVYTTITSPELWAEWTWLAQPGMHWHTSVRAAGGEWRAMPGTVAVGVSYP